MTEPPGPSLEKCCAADRLSGPARRVHLAVLAVFTATGRPPPLAELERLARAHGGPPPLPVDAGQAAGLE